MDRYNITPFFSQSFYAFFAPVRRAVVHDPENSFSRFIRLLAHDLRNKTFKRLDATCFFTSSENFCSFYIPCCQISQCPFSLILMFYTYCLSRHRGRSDVFSISCLNAGFFVGTNYIIVISKWASFPYAIIKIQDTSCFLLKIRVPRKNPTAILPRLNSIFTQPSPNRGATYFSNNSTFGRQISYVSACKSRQWNAKFRRQLTGECFYFYGHVRGKKQEVSPFCLHLQDHQSRSLVRRRPDGRRQDHELPRL